jgi:NADPH:quinone reductase-like Zn-dependent oxidoreductase
MMTYKRIILKKYGGTEELQLIEEPSLPEPKDKEVRIKVLYTSANFTDIMIRKGMYPEVKEKPPFSPGYDMVGVVDQVGDAVTRFREGDKVADMTVIGAYSEYICLHENRLIHLPDKVDPAEAVSTILSYVTAYQMLHRIAKIQKGQKILVHGAGGAVGLAMLQLGKLMNLEMYGTASPSKHDLIIENGAIPIDYRKTDFASYIKNNTSKGVDAVFDPIGGKNFKKSFGLLKKKGKLVAYGFYNTVMGNGGSIPKDFMNLQLWNILPNLRKATFYSIGSLRKKHPDWFIEDLTAIFKMLGDKKIQPLIERKIKIDQAAEAHQIIENRQNKGKIIFQLN